ncbi:MAG: DUF4440 domain-containing protein [Candidatus Baltobacteraceae bacterium]
MPGLGAIVLLYSLLAVLPSPSLAAQPDADAIAALRYENNHAIRSHDVALMRKSWSPHIRLIESDGTLFTGPAILAESYVQTEFRDANFISYRRIPKTIVVAADGRRASEYGTWKALYRPPKHGAVGTYFASWRKIGVRWQIVYEAYVRC